MDWTTIISIVGIIGTWVTIALVYFTLQEMRNQRRAAQKPELIIPIVEIFGYASEKDIFIASSWSNTELKNDEVLQSEYPSLAIYNIGTGAAKEINIKWNFDLSNTVKSIQDYCYRNSIPVVVSIQKNTLNIEYKESKSFANIEANLSYKHKYLMPASVTSHGLESRLPSIFLDLLSILIFLDAHRQQKKEKDKTITSVEEPQIEIPELFCELSYVDIGGDRYLKKFDVVFQPYMLIVSFGERELKGNERVFRGIFEFKEKSKR